MSLQPAAFERFLRHVGQDVLWRRAFDCPCRDTYSGAALPNCLQCAGKGSIWAAPLASYTGLSSMAASVRWAKFGVWETGDLLLTIPGDTPLYNAGQYDQVILLESSEPFSLVLTRGVNDRLPWPVVGIDRVFVLSEDDNDVQVTLDTALPTVGTGGVLTWPSSGLTPAVGQQFSITGRRRPVYFLYMDLPSDRAHHGGLRLPRKVVVRQFDLFNR